MAETTCALIQEARLAKIHKSELGSHKVIAGLIAERDQIADDLHATTNTDAQAVSGDQAATSGDASILSTWRLLRAVL
jgi:hypothetical protein